MPKLRIAKVYYENEPPTDGSNNTPFPPEMVARYEVQVKGLFFWHTIRDFKRLITAVRLYKDITKYSDV